MATVLVTGATGRLGSRMAAALAARGHRVVAAVRTADRLRPEGPMAVPLDVTQPRTFQALPGDIEVILHAAAARLGPERSPAALQRVIRTNALGTLHVLAYAQEAGVKKVVYCSSVSVYALPQPLPIAETGRTYPVEAPDAFYGASKLSGELLCEQFRLSRRLRCLSLRLGRVYGPGEPSDSFVRRWAEQARRGEELLVYGDGRRSQDFLYLEDALQGLLAAVEGDWEGGVVNLSSGTETTWGEMAQAIGETFAPSRAPARIRTLPEGPRSRCCVDISRSRALLGFSPRYTVAEGLRAWRAEEPSGGAPEDAPSAREAAGVR